MNRLWVRLSVAVIAIVWLSIGVIAVVVHLSTERNFRQYVNRRDASFFDADTIGALEVYYAENGTWTGVDSLLPGPKGTGGTGSGHGQGQGQGGQGRGAQVLLADTAGQVVASTDPARVGTTLDQDTLDRAQALSVDGQQVGWLYQETPGEQALGQAETSFLYEATWTLAITALFAALLAVVIGGLLAWQLTRPMRTLTEAAHALAEGQLGQQVEVVGTQEVTELAQAFNRMSHDLAEGEAQRQRMAADIAHELRTPVTVLRGHLEAMLDGVFPLDGEHLAVAYDSTIHMTHLVDDLRLLTRAETGQLPLERGTVPSGELVTRAVERFAPLALDAEVTLDSSVAPDLPPVLVDADRMQQVFGNLLSNALRHTPTGGRIRVTVTRAGDAVRFAVSNSGTGLTAEQAEQVFTPFWRADEARARDQGGSGLGLAIVRQLLTLHGGRIWVEPDPAGTTFVFELPAAPGVG